jgi:hypothetical protein
MRGDLDLVLEQAHERPGTVHRCRFSVGGVSVQLVAARNTDVVLGPLEPFRVEQAASDIQICIEWASSLRLPEGPQVFDSGSVWRLYDDGPGFRFDFSTPQLGERPYKRLFVDRQFRDAELQLNRECFADSDDAVDCMEYPLDELLIMHRLTQERAIELHGSGIVRANGVGNLFVGHSGAGKSTTTRLWTSREEVEVLSDDRIIVRPDQPRDGHSDLSALGPMRMYGTPWHGEAMFASPNSAPLTRIFVLEHGHGNVITRLNPSQAVGELFARAFVPFHRHEYVESALSFLEQLADSVPCYRYSFEPDERAVEKIQHFND